MGAGGNPVSYTLTLPSNFMPICPQPQHGNAHLCKPAVRAKPHLSQNRLAEWIVVLSTQQQQAPKPLFSMFRWPQVPGVKLSDHQWNDLDHGYSSSNFCLRTMAKSKIQKSCRCRCSHPSKCSSRKTNLYTIKNPWIYNGETTASLTTGAGKIGLLHVRE